MSEKEPKMPGAEEKEEVEEGRVEKSLELMDRVSGLNEIVTNLGDRLDKLGILGDPHPSSSTVGADISHYLKLPREKQGEIYNEMIKLEKEVFEALKSHGLDTSVVSELGSYARVLFDAALRNEKKPMDIHEIVRLDSEYGIRFKARLDTLRRILGSLGFKNPENKYRSG